MNSTSIADKPVLGLQRTWISGRFEGLLQGQSSIVLRSSIVQDFLGQKVVCIDDKFGDTALALYKQLPVEKVVYVIRAIRLGIKTDCKTGDISLLLIGLDNPKSGKPPFHEFGFSSDRFRPLDEIQERNQAARQEPSEIRAKVLEEVSSI